MAAVNVQLTPPLGFDQRSNFTTMGFIQADRTHPSLKRKFGPVFGAHLSTEQVKKIKTNPESFDGQSIQDYLASTAGIPGRDTSKLNLEIPLSALTAVPTPGVCARAVCPKSWNRLTFPVVSIHHGFR